MTNRSLGVRYFINTYTIVLILTQNVTVFPFTQILSLPEKRAIKLLREFRYEPSENRACVMFDNIIKPEAKVYLTLAILTSRFIKT